MCQTMNLLYLSLGLMELQPVQMQCHILCFLLFVLHLKDCASLH